MNNQPGSDKPTTPPDPAKLDPIDRGLAKFKGYFQERRAKKEKQTPADRASVSTARATWAIAIFTLVTVGIGVSHYFAFHGQVEAMKGQLGVMRETLAEMKTSAPQTTKLVEANEKLAQATANMAATAKANLETTGAIAGRQLRAHVSINFAEVPDFVSGSPVGVKIQVKNTGQGVANGQMRSVVKIGPSSTSKFPIDRGALVAGVTVNPNDSYFRPTRTMQTLSYEQMEAIATGNYAIIAYGDYRYSDESGAVTNCVFRLFSRGWSRNSNPTLHPTAHYNGCKQERAAAAQ